MKLIMPQMFLYHLTHVGSLSLFQVTINLTMLGFKRRSMGRKLMSQQVCKIHIVIAINGQDLFTQGQKMMRQQPTHTTFSRTSFSHQSNFHTELQEQNKTMNRHTYNKIRNTLIEKDSSKSIQKEKHKKLRQKLTTPQVSHIINNVSYF